MVEFSEFFLALATDFAAGARNGYRDVTDHSMLRTQQSTNGRGFRDVCDIRRLDWQRAGMAAVV